MKRIAVLTTALMALTVPAWASYDTGWYAYIAGDFVLAHGEWLPLAEDGDARAQYQLGVMYQRGEGVDADTTEAARWYGLAADQGYAPSKINLARLYYTGDGVAHDLLKSHMWLSMAAMRGSKLARERLAVIIERMTGNEIAQAETMRQALINGN